MPRKADVDRRLRQAAWRATREAGYAASAAAYQAQEAERAAQHQAELIAEPAPRAGADEPLPITPPTFYVTPALRAVSANLALARRFRTQYPDLDPAIMRDWL